MSIEIDKNLLEKKDCKYCKHLNVKYHLEIIDDDTTEKCKYYCGKRFFKKLPSLRTCEKWEYNEAWEENKLEKIRASLI